MDVWTEGKKNKNKPNNNNKSHHQKKKTWQGGEIYVNWQIYYTLQPSLKTCQKGSKVELRKYWYLILVWPNIFTEYILEFWN